MTTRAMSVSDPATPGPLTPFPKPALVFTGQKLQNHVEAPADCWTYVTLWGVRNMYIVEQLAYETIKTTSDSRGNWWQMNRTTLAPHSCCKQRQQARPNDKLIIPHTRHSNGKRGHSSIHAAADNKGTNTPSRERASVTRHHAVYVPAATSVGCLSTHTHSRTGVETRCG